LSAGNSTYHALQATLNKRFSHGFTVLANYTWSKTIDNADDDANNATNPFNISFDKGPSNFDIEHRFVSSFIWDLPQPKTGSRLLSRLIGGWETNGIVTLESGLPFSIVSGRDNSNSGVNLDRADLIGSPSLPSGRTLNQILHEYFNVTAFAPNRIGTFGNTGRNSLRGPGAATVDFGLLKNIPVTEKMRVQFRAEAFNVLNRVNFSNPNNNQSSPTFGVITNASDPRVLQMALKFMF
jgi:hypothetical protein